MNSAMILLMRLLRDFWRARAQRCVRANSVTIAMTGRRRLYSLARNSSQIRCGCTQRRCSTRGTRHEWLGRDDIRRPRSDTWWRGILQPESVSAGNALQCAFPAWVSSCGRDRPGGALGRKLALQPYHPFFGLGQIGAPVFNISELSAVESKGDVIDHAIVVLHPYEQHELERGC